MIQLSEVNKVFGRRPAVVGPEPECAARRYFPVCSATTARRARAAAIGMMLGQVWPTRGEVRVGGFDVTRQRSHALEKVGAIFESPVFYDYLQRTAQPGNPQPLHRADSPATHLMKSLRWSVSRAAKARRSGLTRTACARAIALAQALLQHASRTPHSRRTERWPGPGGHTRNA